MTSVRIFVSSVQCARTDLPPPEFRQSGEQLVQALWRPERDQVIAATTRDLVGTKLRLSGVPGRGAGETREGTREETREDLASDGFQTIIRRVRGGEEPSGKTSGLILDMIRRQPEITIPEMAGAPGKSTRAIEMQLAKLRKSRKVQRIGPAKGGRWEIIGDEDE